MKATVALVRRELLEHRGAFVIAPAVLVLALCLMIVAAFGFGRTEFATIGPAFQLSGSTIYAMAVSVIFAAWAFYLLIALGFYFADSFSADRRNNSLLFWKSMPQSDLRMLASKALAGGTIFPALIFCFAMATALLVHLGAVLLAFRMPILPVLPPTQMLGIWLEKSVCGAAYLVLSVLWYAPVLAWIAALSTVVQRWAIPLAFLIPGAAVIVEAIFSFGNQGAVYPIRSYLTYRMHNGVIEDKQALVYLANNDRNPVFGLIGVMIRNIDWLQMGLGIVFALVMIYAASEYRRRRIDA